MTKTTFNLYYTDKTDGPVASAELDDFALARMRSHDLVEQLADAFAPYCEPRTMLIECDTVGATLTQRWVPIAESDEQFRHGIGMYLERLVSEFRSDPEGLTVEIDDD